MRRLMRAFFGLGDNVDFHCIDCRLVSGSYVNTHVSSQVIIEFNKFVLVQNPPVSPYFWSFPSHTFTQFCQDFNVILLIYRLAAGYPLCHHNTLDIKENNQHALEIRRLMRAIFGLGNDVDFHCIDCRLVSGSYVNTHVSSQVIIEINKFDSFTVRRKSPNTVPCDILFVHLTAVLEPFLHKPFSCSILPLEFVEHFPYPN